MFSPPGLLCADEIGKHVGLRWANAKGTAGSHESGVQVGTHRGICHRGRGRQSLQFVIGPMRRRQKEGEPSAPLLVAW